MKAALVLQVLAVIAPAPMLAVTLPPKLKCTVNRAVVLPLMSWTAVTLPPALPVRVRSLVWTDAWINSLVEVHVIVIVARRWRRERAANRRVSRSHH